MHLGLRTILGTHVEQKGSLVNPNHLRFDFSHFAKLSDEELRQVEDFVNKRISAQLQLKEHRNLPIKEALEKGAMALFGEKYGDTVRMIEFGESKELCGGIHVKNTGEIWYFKILSEGAVAAGIRRIEAITGDAVKEYFSQQEIDLEAINETLKNPQDTLKAVVSLQDDNAKLKKQIEQLLKEKIQSKSKEIVSNFKLINGINFISQSVDFDANSTKDLAFVSGSTQSNTVVVLGSITDGKPSIACYVSDDLYKTKGLNASNIVKDLGKYIDGGGGGQPTLASAGGKKLEGLEEALEKAIDFVK
jgi:alanyl-tRNA synthetase